MKKIYSIILAVGLGFTINAQCISTFDGFTLPADSNWNGADLTGDFSDANCTDVVFENVYDTAWGGYWANGFAYSNQVNTAAIGTDGQYDSYAGSDFTSGGNFVVGQAGFSSPEVSFGWPASNVDFYVTNVSYAANSMKYGDFFGKVFGDTVDASGLPDSTNGEDYFMLTAYALDQNGLPLDSVEVYLADYRFADSTQDYIADTWIPVSFAIGGIWGISFSLSSSDVGSFGMNTPGFFALDQFSYVPLPIGVNEIEKTINLYPNPAYNVLNIEGENEGSKILSVSGQTVLNISKDQQSVNIELLSKGIYTIITETTSGEVINKFIKE